MENTGSGKGRSITFNSMLSSSDFRRGAEQVLRGIPFNPEYPNTKHAYYYEWGRFFGVWMKINNRIIKKWRARDGSISERLKILQRKAAIDGIYN